MRVEDLLKQWIEVQSAGIPLAEMAERIGGDLRDTRAALVIRQSGEYGPAEIRRLPSGCFAYVLPIFVRWDAPGKVTLRNLRVSTPGVYTYIEAVDCPAGDQRCPDCYTFPGSSDRIALEALLNDRLRNLTLQRWDFVEGVVAALGNRPAGHSVDVKAIPITITVTDQRDREYAKTLSVPIHFNRVQKRTAAKPSLGSVLPKRDVIEPGTRSLKAPPAPIMQTDQQLAEEFSRTEQEILALWAKNKHDRESNPIETEIADVCEYGPSIFGMEY